MALSFRQFRNLARNLSLSGIQRNPQKRCDHGIFPPVFNFKDFHCRDKRHIALEGWGTCIQEVQDMRAFVIIVIAAVLGFFGYEYAAKGLNPVEAIGALAGQAGEAAESAVEVAGDAAEGAADMAESATDSVTDVSADAVEAVEGAVEGITDAAADAADAATEMATDAADATTEMATDAVEATADTAEAGSDLMGNLLGAVDPASLLTVDGFDAEKVTAFIEASGLSDGVKSQLTTAVSAAGDNPEMVQTVIDQIKSVMGL